MLRPLRELSFVQIAPKASKGLGAERRKLRACCRAMMCRPHPITAALLVSLALWAMGISAFIVAFG